MIGNHFIYPPSTSSTEPVGEHRVTRPDFTDVQTPIGIGQEGSSSRITSRKWGISALMSASEPDNNGKYLTRH